MNRAFFFFFFQNCAQFLDNLISTHKEKRFPNLLATTVWYERSRTGVDLSGD